MLDKLEYMMKRFHEVEKLTSDPDVLRDQKKYKKIMQEYSHLQAVHTGYESYKQLLEDIDGARMLAEEESDPEMKEMAKEELAELETRKPKLESEIKKLLVPPDPLDGKNIIMEIRAGTGGDESALFCADLYRMYSRYAEKKKWKMEIMSASSNEIGGYKELIVSVAGKQVYSFLRYESGVHRVQRVPATESGGRIHTSAVTIAVLPEAEETDVEVRQEELKIDVFRSSGPGGQSVNTTDSAVRLTHLPSGLVVICQDEKSQIKNKAKALKVLRSRLLEQESRKLAEERAKDRKSQVGSGDRSERIRTYNFPQNRMTDHRINLTLYKLDAIIQGELDETIENLKLHAQQEAMQE